MMRGRPENAAAFWTPREILLCRKNIGWDHVFYGCLRAALKDDVAFQTATEGMSQRLEMTGFNHLPDLLAVVVALNKKEIRRLFFL